MFKNNLLKGILLFLAITLLGCKESTRQEVENDDNPSNISNLVWEPAINPIPQNKNQIVIANMSGWEETKLPEYLYQMPNLQVIDLSNSKIDSIPPEFTSFKNLRTLYLDNSKVKYVPDELMGLDSLTSIQWSGTEFPISKDSILNQTWSPNFISTEFDEQTVAQAAYVYKKIGEDEVFSELISAYEPKEKLSELNRSCRRTPKLWEYKRIEVGFIPKPKKGDEKIIGISSATSIEPDLTLRNKKLNFNLSYLRASDYPGKGLHNVFFGYNVTTIGSSPNPNSEFSFNQNFQVQESDEPSLRSVPVFNGLSSGKDGVLINCSVVNVSNKNDETLSKVFQAGKDGLNILGIGQANPALKMVTGIADEALKLIKSSHENIPIHDIKLGLHFNHNGVDMQLREGSYVVLGIPNCINGLPYNFTWNNFEFNRETGKLQGKNGVKIDLNYLVFTVNK